MENNMEIDMQNELKSMKQLIHMLQCQVLELEKEVNELAGEKGALMIENIKLKKEIMMSLI